MRALRVLQQRGEAVRARVQGEVAARLDGRESGLIGAAVEACASIDAEGRRVLGRDGAQQPACSAGCSYCCHVHADATVPELIAIAAWLRRTRRPQEIAALREELAHANARVEGMSDEARWAAKIPCALLGDDGRCTIYEARPLRCRAFHSAAVEPCRAAFAGSEDVEPLTLATLDRALDAVEEGYDAALAEAGLSPAGYRLEAGLLVALEEPEAGARWLAGEDVFARARPRS